MVSTRYLLTLANFVVASSTQSTHKTGACKPGFDLIDGMCTRKVIKPLVYSCPFNSVLNGTVCLREIFSKFTCPGPAVIVGTNECVEHETYDPIVECPIGYQKVDGGCKTTKPLYLEEYCEHGSREGSECVAYETEPHVVNYSCPEGYSREEVGCYKQEEYDCTPLMPATHRLLHGVKKLVQGDLQITKQLCKRVEVMPLQKLTTCPPDSIEVRGKCTRKIVHPLSTRCIDGKPMEHCFEELTADPIMDCHRGGKLTGGKCVISRHVQPQFVCEHGRMVGDKCIVELQATESCPEPTFREDDHCVFIEKHTPSEPATLCPVY